MIGIERLKKASINFSDPKITKGELDIGRWHVG